MPENLEDVISLAALIFSRKNTPLENIKAMMAAVESGKEGTNTFLNFFRPGMAELFINFFVDSMKFPGLQ